MRVIAKTFPEFSMFENISEMEDPYYISEDGLGRQEAVATVQAKTRLESQNVFNMNDQRNNFSEGQNNGQPGPSQPKKKGFFQKLLRR